MAVHDNPADRARWTKGGGSPNPGGQTKAQAQARRLVADLVAAETDGGKEIVLFALDVMRGGEVATGGGDAGVEIWDQKSRRWAADFLANRLWGKAPLVVDVSKGEVAPLPDLSGMSIAELRDLQAQAAAVASGETQSDEPPDRVH
jgi:hypothetical protein